MIEVPWLAGPSALVAALATVVGAITLTLFFMKGGLWGLLNDIASIVLMLATIPVALALPRGVSGLDGWHEGITFVGVTGMIGASGSQALLIARRFTYEQLLPWTLGFGAVVGVWYLLIGLGHIRLGLFGPELIDTLAIVAGISFIALGYGWLRGNERHPVSIVAGIALLISSTWFLTWIGLLFLSGDIYAG
jgi:hypothetical protein